MKLNRFVMKYYSTVFYVNRGCDGTPLIKPKQIGSPSHEIRPVY